MERRTFRPRPAPSRERLMLSLASFSGVAAAAVRLLWVAAAIGLACLATAAAGGPGDPRYRFGTLLDVAWPALMLVIACAAWQKPIVAKGGWVQGWRALAITFGVIGLCVLTYDHWHEIHDVAIVLATLTVVAALAHTAVTSGHLRTLAHGKELLLQNELILNSAGEGIIGVDAGGAVTFANPAAARMTQYASEEMTGRGLHGLLHHTRADGNPYPADECPMVAAAGDGTSRRGVDDLIWRKDGTSLPIEYTSTPIADGAHAGGAVLVFRDVTERREIQRVKDEFTSVVSHELRTPLTSIRGSLGLLESGALGPLPEQGQRMIRIAVENTDRLVRLINDILDLERGDSAAIYLRQARCDAAQLIARATEGMLPVAAGAGVTLSIDAEPTPFVADADRVIQTLTNLIGNAVKFSPAGSTVEVMAERRGGEVLFRVSDRGRGIPVDKLETIFERFQQVDASDSRQNGGTGLGLAICRSNVEHHGGRIWAWSAPGEGSTFSFLMPAALDEPDGCAPLLRPRAGAVGPRPASVFRVLFVEPDAGTAELLSAIFERYAVETYAATNVREAIEVCPRVLPDLLVLELDLPIADGVEFLDWLRLHERLSALPIVVYTARDLEAAQREHLALSLTTQPLNRDEITPEEFEARVMTLLRPTLATAAKEVGHEPATHPVGR